MKVKIKALLVFFLLTSTNSVFAGGSITNMSPIEIMSGGYIDNVDGKSYTRIRLSASHANPDSCSSSTFIVLDPADTALYEERFSIVMTAIANNMKLAAWTTSCTSDMQYATLLRLSLVK